MNNYLPFFRAVQQHRKRLVSLYKTDAVAVNTDRHNADRLDEIWGSGTDCFQAIPADGRSDDGEPMLLRLNIDGTSYQLLIETILQAELTGFLSKFVQLNHKSRLKVADAYIVFEDAYYFQRSPFAFDAIFQYYATGVVHKPPEICPVAFLAELEFWGISYQSIGSCCVDTVTQNQFEEKEKEKVDNKTFDNLIFGNVRRKMWTFLERPGSSVQAKAFELSSTLFVAIFVKNLNKLFQDLMKLHSSLAVGKVIASAAIMCGVLVLALPITIIVDNFIKVAKMNNKRSSKDWIIYGRNEECNRC